MALSKHHRRYTPRTIAVGSVLLASLAIVVVLSCTVITPDAGGLTILFYNVENLFDGTLDGTEYDEFTPSAGWDDEDTTDRLQRIGEVLESAPEPPDIIGIAEIENEKLLDRLFDHFVVDRPYPYRVFSSNVGGATGVALVSRYPIIDVHTLQARAGETPPLRPVIEAHIQLPETVLVVFVNHWKSKRGGAAATESLRIASARLVATRIGEILERDPTTPIAVCGDLNEEPREVENAKYLYDTAVLPAEYVADWIERVEEPPDWFDPDVAVSHRILHARDVSSARRLSEAIDRPVLIDSWSQLATEGSYWFYTEWEQIDHIMVNAECADGPYLGGSRFFVHRDPRWCDDEGRPLSWFDDPQGASDHLPVLLQLEMDIK